MILTDTCVLIEYFKENPAVTKTIDNTFNRKDFKFIPGITFFDYKPAREQKVEKVE